MDQNDRETIRQRILILIAELENELSTANKSGNYIAPDNAIGRLSRMEAIQAQNINKAVLDIKHRRLIRLREALSKIDLPQFGECCVCGDEIDIKRFLASPETNVCGDCIKESKRNR